MSAGIWKLFGSYIVTPQAIEEQMREEFAARDDVDVAAGKIQLVWRGEGQTRAE